MSDLTDAVETMMAALSDAMGVWREVGERVTAAEAKAAKAEAATAALAMRVRALEKERTPDFGAMFRGVAKRLDALERASGIDSDWINETVAAVERIERRLGIYESPVEDEDTVNADPDGV